MCIVRSVGTAHQNRAQRPIFIQRPFRIGRSQYEFWMDGMPHYFFMDLGTSQCRQIPLRDNTLYPAHQLYALPGRDNPSIVQRILPIRSLRAFVVMREETCTRTQRTHNTAASAARRHQQRACARTAHHTQPLARRWARLG